MFPFKDVETAEHIDTPLSNDMVNALDLWYQTYLNKAPWLKDGHVHSLNLPAVICSEITRQILLEVKWTISGGKGEGANGQDATNERSEYLKAEFKKLMDVLFMKLEHGCAAGGMTIKPYPKDGHIFFDYTMAWSLYPIAFGDDGDLTDVIFRDAHQDGKVTYTRLERHTVEGTSIKITQRAFRSQNRDTIGSEIPLSDVPRWSELQPEVTLQNADGQMFGWFKVASANSVDVDGPMGVSVYHKAIDIIEQADIQYSRFLWEYEGSELAIDVDPTALRSQIGTSKMEMPKLNDRLFRGVDLGTDNNYNVFSPPIRDASLIAGLNQLLIRIENNCGLARGTLSDTNVEARTATEIMTMRQRTYVTIANNQAALERCLRSVIRAMDKYASLYNLAPDGEYDVSFDWDDSIITDAAQQLGERLGLMSQGIMSKVELRQWYFGETEVQAKAAIQAIQQELAAQSVDALLAGIADRNAPQTGA